MTTHTFTGTVTDPMAATDTDTETINSTALAPLRVVRRSFMENRQMWGFVGDTTPRGPLYSDEYLYSQTFYSGLPNPVTVSMCWNVQIPVRFTGCRIYKAPNANGTATPLTLWSVNGTPGEGTTGTVLASTTFTWTVDAGGWRQIDFPSPIDLVPGVEYVLGYTAHDGIFAWTPWVWHAQDTCVWPLHNINLYERTTGNINGIRTQVGTPTPGPTTFPVNHVAHNFYIDPLVEWDDPLPEGFSNPAYWDQWTHTNSRHAFPVGVFFSDPEYISEYYAMGVNTLFAGAPHVSDNAQRYIDAMDDIDYAMDWWPTMAIDLTTSSFNPSAAFAQLMDEYPGLDDCIVGYLIDDEPDLVGSYRSPDLHRAWITALRSIDSTRPIYMTFSQIATRNQRYYGHPEGASWLVKNQTYRDWARNLDMIACDDYVWYYDNNAWGIFGVWTYAAQVGRMRELCDDRTPVQVVVETCGNVVGAPTPDQVKRATWAGLIAGARGVCWFDHRFAGPYQGQDFAAMLHDAPMKAAITALNAQLQTLGPALLGPDLGLITAYTSSNTTAGPQGGTRGVPLHYTTRTDGTYEYAFVQAIRTGTTTGTVTIPTWASEVVDVIDESRTETVSVGGVITDTFTGDCEYHLYRRTL